LLAFNGPWEKGGGGMCGRFSFVKLLIRTFTCTQIHPHSPRSWRNL